MSFPKLRAIAAALALASISGAGSAVAPPPNTASFAVIANVVPSCTVLASDLIFGATITSPILVPIDMESTITVNCPAETPYNVKLELGNVGSTFALRKLVTGPNSINYSLYRTAAERIAETPPWGNGSAGSAFKAIISASGFDEFHTVFGRIFAQGGFGTGLYLDAITVNITF